jgi:hypothetical protein
MFFGMLGALACFVRKNYQVLAYGYALKNDDLTINVYDHSDPDNAYVTIFLNISDPKHTTPIDYFQVAASIF